MGDFLRSAANFLFSESADQFKSASADLHGREYGKAATHAAFGTGLAALASTADVLRYTLPYAELGIGLAMGMEDCPTGGKGTISRVDALKSAIPAAQQGRITMAVGLAEDASGTPQVLVATSEPRGYLRPGVTLDPGETMAPGLGHAEADIADMALRNGLRLIEVGATRPICPTCAIRIEQAGARPVTPLKYP